MIINVETPHATIYHIKKSFPSLAYLGNGLNIMWRPTSAENTGRYSQSVVKMAVESTQSRETERASSNLNVSSLYRLTIIKQYQNVQLPDLVH